MTPLVLIVLLVALQRLGEMGLAAYNTRRLKAQGGIEVGKRHYPLFILLHLSWLLAILGDYILDTHTNMM
jgi:methyltransferase